MRRVTSIEPNSETVTERRLEFQEHLMGPVHSDARLEKKSSTKASSLSQTCSLFLASPGPIGHHTVSI